MSASQNFVALLPEIEAVLHEAGALALKYFRPGAPTSAAVHTKEGGSPVTDADYSVDVFLREKLAALAPEAGWLSEETVDTPERLSRDLVFIVDPIDGTRGFAAGDPCFAVCAALILRGRPVCAVVRAPALDETFVATLHGGARRNGQPIKVSDRTEIAGARLAAPEPLASDLRRAGLAYAQRPKLPSLAMRLLRVAEGAYDGALARPNACDWDIAAADLILSEAGGGLTDFAGRAPHYNRVAPQHPELAAGPSGLRDELIRAARDGQTLRFTTKPEEI